MNQKALERAINATVQIPYKGGQGVLVGDGLILTAAHCLEYDDHTGAGITLGDRPIVEIEAYDGTKLKTTPWVIESVSDVALLGPLDNQECWEEVEALERFCLKTKGIPILRSVFSGQRLPVLIRSHKQIWIEGETQQTRPRAHQAWVEAREQIEAGTSGGPIITHDGKLVGIVSHFSETGGKCYGLTPIPHLTLPAWAVKLACKRRFEGYL